MTGRPRARLLIGLAIVIVLIGIGLLVYGDLFGFDTPVLEAAVAPTLAADQSGQAVYRIAAGESLVRYQVEEQFAGEAISVAEGVTRQVAGDIQVDRGTPSASRVGTIVINVEAFESDSGLRDRRIRREYLESARYPEATFSPTQIDGLPEAIVDGQAVDFTMHGDLTVRDVTQPATWTVRAVISGDRLTGTAETTLSMAQFGVGPIDIAGLVTTADAVRLTFVFAAERVD